MAAELQPHLSETGGDGQQAETDAVRARKEEYRSILDGLERIRQLVGSNELELPQICVVGNQNQGKSSLLEALTGVEFPEGDGTVTRAAAVVSCRFDAALEQNAYEVGSSEGATVEEAAVADAIDAAQKALFEGEENRGKKISTESIPIRVRGPSQVDMNVVDLPGLIAQGEGQQETRALVEGYILPETTLILLVSEAKEDDENVAAIELVRQVDPTGARTMRVLTKFDSFDTPKAEEKALRLVRDGGDGPLGAHAVVCRPNGEAYSAARERETLAGVAGARAGVESLKVRLLEEYGRLVAKNLPKLRQEISDDLQKTKARLDGLGWEEPDSRGMVDRLQEALLEKMDGAVKRRITKDFTAFKEAIHDLEKNVTLKWVGAKMQHNAFDNPLFQGAKETESCMREIVEQWWSVELDKYAGAALGAAAELLQWEGDETRPQGVSTTLMGFTASAWEAHVSGVLAEDFKRSCAEALDREVEFGTCNHYLTSEFNTGKTVLPDELLDKIVRETQSLGEKIYYGTLSQDKAGFRDRLDRDFPDLLKACRAEWATEFASKDLFDQQKEVVHAGVRALYTVEKKTFTDIILKVTRDLILNRGTDWLRKELLRDGAFREHAVEDAEASSQRRRLLDHHGSMRSAEAEVNRMSNVGGG